MSTFKKSPSTHGQQLGNAFVLAAISSAAGFAHSNALAHTSKSAHDHKNQAKNTGANSICHTHSHTHVNSQTKVKTTHSHKHCHPAGSDHKASNAHIHHSVKNSSAKLKKNSAIEQAQLDAKKMLGQDIAPPITYIEPPAALQYQAGDNIGLVQTMQAQSQSQVQNLEESSYYKPNLSAWEKHNRSADIGLALANSNTLTNVSTQQLGRNVISTESNNGVGASLGLRFQNNLENSSKGVYMGADIAYTEARNKIVENTTNVELYNDSRGNKSTKSDLKVGMVAHSDANNQVIPYLQLQDNRQSVSYANQKSSNSNALIGLMVQTKLNDHLVLEGNAGYGRVLRANASQEAIGTDAAYDLDLGTGAAIDVGLRMSYELSARSNIFAEAKHTQARLKELTSGPVSSGTRKDNLMRMGLSWNY